MFQDFLMSSVTTFFIKPSVYLFKQIGCVQVLPFPMQGHQIILKWFILTDHPPPSLRKENICLNVMSFFMMINVLSDAD